VNAEPNNPPAREGGGDHGPSAAAPRTGEGASTALEAMLRKRKQVESNEPADSDPPPKPSPR
jgi:hypothetical protein